MPTTICYYQAFINFKKPLRPQKVKENTLSKFYFRSHIYAVIHVKLDMCLHVKIFFKLS